LGGFKIFPHRHAVGSYLNVDRALAVGGGVAGRAEDDAFNRVIVREHRHYGVALARVRNLSGAARALLHQRLRLAGGAVENCDLVSGFQQIGRNTRPHIS
jgi:hypothetical protein